GVKDRPVLIAASTQPGEEDFVLNACAELWDVHPDLLLLIAPRRPERFDEVETCIAKTGRSHQRRTRAQDQLSPETQVLLPDRVGELVRFLPFAAAVFVGGTVTPIGGHNVREPARYGKPVAFGSSLDNVADAARALLDQGGAVLVRDASELTRHWQRCLDDRAFADAMGARAKAVALAGSAVVERTWSMIAPYLDAG